MVNGIRIGSKEQFNKETIENRAIVMVNWENIGNGYLKLELITSQC